MNWFWCAWFRDLFSSHFVMLTQNENKFTICNVIRASVPVLHDKIAYASSAYKISTIILIAMNKNVCCDYGGIVDIPVYRINRNVYQLPAPNDRNNSQFNHYGHGTCICWMSTGETCLKQAILALVLDHRCSTKNWMIQIKSSVSRLLQMLQVQWAMKCMEKKKLLH